MANDLWSCTCCTEALTCWLRLKLSPEEIEQRYRSKEIDRILEKDKQTLRRQVKLLLLGAGESGKSTFLKQMRIIHKVKFEPELVREYQHVIYQNIVKGIQVLVDARDKLAIPWENPRNLDIGQQALHFNSTATLDNRLFMHYAPHIHSLWLDRAIKRAYDRRREFQLVSDKSYLMSKQWPSGFFVRSLGIGDLCLCSEYSYTHCLYCGFLLMTCLIVTCSCLLGTIFVHLKLKYDNIV